jgi:hypothetical protein
VDKATTDDDGEGITSCITLLSEALSVEVGAILQLTVQHQDATQPIRFVLMAVHTAGRTSVCRTWTFGYLCI